VIGFDDIQMSALTHPALTTVRQPMQQLGETAVTLLFDRLQNSHGLPRHEVLGTMLVVRQSCGCPIPSNLDN
jgi:LacI family transcriptional regulator